MLVFVNELCRFLSQLQPLGPPDARAETNHIAFAAFILGTFGGFHNGGDRSTPWHRYCCWNSSGIGRQPDGLRTLPCYRTIYSPFTNIMRLQIEPNVTALPLVEGQVSDNGAVSYDIDALLKTGVAAAQNGERDFARVSLTKVTEIDPQCEDAWMWLASISEYPEELLALLDRVLAINADNQKAQEWRLATRAMLAKTFVQRAVAAREEGSMDLVAECVQQAIEHDNNCEAAWSLKAELAADDHAKFACFERVLEINPENEEAANAVAEIKRQRLDASFGEAKAAAVAGKRKKALELVDEFLLSVPDNAEAWVLRSHLALDLEDKMNSLESALAIDPENAAAKAGHEFLKATFAPAEVVEVVAEERIPVVYDDAPVVEEVEVLADEVPVVYDDESSVEDAPIQAPMDEELFAPAERPVPETRLAEQPIPAPRDEELIAPVERFVPDTRLTEQPSPEADAVEAAPEQFGADVDEPENGTYEFPQTEATVASGVPCPFCKAASGPQSFECLSCNAVLSLSDIESLISNDRVRRDLIQEAISQMEAEWNLREFNEDELTTLAIGHFNLQNFAPGFTYLQEASRLSPNNVILAGQVNSLQIRMDEIARQNEINEGKPKGKTILVVDDSPTVRKLISGKLEKSGHNVVCACDGVEALERLEANLPDLVLLDITMPRMDGYEVCKRIRSNPAAHDLPVVMISGKDGFFDKVRGRMAGTSGYVTKPFGPETLMKALETYLRPEVV